MQSEENIHKQVTQWEGTMEKFTRSFEKATIAFKTIDKEPKVLWEKPCNGKATDTEIVNAIGEFTAKHWDKKTPWVHEIDSTFEVYEMTQETFMKHATKLTGEVLEKRIAQMEKQRAKRGSK